MTYAVHGSNFPSVRKWYILFHMAKRKTGVGQNKTSRSKKTKKRLAVKHAKLAGKKKAR